MTPDLAPEPAFIRLLDPLPRDAFPFLAFPLNVDGFYASLIRRATSVEAGLGGRLLDVGELGEDGRALMVAANIAGAASLASTADMVAQKQAIHDGVADFLVTNLDEALRILKNEIRKHEPVAVCIAASPTAIEQEILERGVLPDFVRDSGADSAPVTPVAFGGSPVLVTSLDPAPEELLLTWSINEAPAKWLPRLDAIAMDCLASDESPSAHIARRWLRLAPRYLGRLAQNARILRCSRRAANIIVQRMRTSIESGEIPGTVRINSVQQ